MLCRNIAFVLHVALDVGWRREMKPRSWSLESNQAASKSSFTAVALLVDWMLRKLMLTSLIVGLFTPKLDYSFTKWPRPACTKSSAQVGIRLRS